MSPAEPSRPDPIPEVDTEKIKVVGELAELLLWGL